MHHLVEELEDAVRLWDRLEWPRPATALVSGSGLAVDLGFQRLGREPLHRFLPLPIEGIEGHPLEVDLLRPPSGRPLLYFRGRLHAYQGHSAAEVVFQARLAALLGARALFLTNASGALDPAFDPGDLVLIRDHLNLTGLNPLYGKPPEAWGPRFPDLTDAYDPDLFERVTSRAAELGIGLREGVYAGLAGPSYETPAEVVMLRTLGAHAVGMSTVLEVIAARHLGVRCCALSMVSNQAAGLAAEPLTHQEVLEAGEQAGERVRTLLRSVLAEL